MARGSTSAHDYNNLANLYADDAKAARLDWIRLQSDPREVARRKAVAREERARDALERLESPEQYAVRVGKPVEEVLKNYNVGAAVWGTRESRA